MSTRPLLLVPATGEPPLPDGFAIAIEASVERITYLLGLFDQLKAARKLNPDIETLTVRDEEVQLILDPRLRQREDGPLSAIARAMRDIEMNVLVDDAVAILRGRRTPTSTRVVVRETYLEWWGFGPERWDSSALWPSALLHAWLMVAEPGDLESLYERLARTDAEFALDVLERGVRFDYPNAIVRELPTPPPRAVAVLLEADSREVRERAIAQLPRLRKSA